jgi:hypothetical protein
MKNISNNSYRENQNKFYVQLYFFKCRAVYEIMWKNNVERGRQAADDITIRHMHIACCVPKASHTQNR